MKLAEVDSEIERILSEEVDGETGELRPEVEQRLDALEMERDRIMLYLARVVIGEECEADAVDAHAKRLAQRAMSHLRRAARLRAFIESRIEYGRKLSDDFAQIGWRKSTAVEVYTDAEKLPSRFVRVSYAPDKVALKAALQAGEEVPDVALVTRRGIVVR